MCVLLSLYTYMCKHVVCLNMCSYFQLKKNSSDDEDPDPRGRQGRQQTGGDTYTLEIAFPAVKYVF